MGKLVPMVLILFVILILFHFGGLVEGTPNHYLFELVNGLIKGEGIASLTVVGYIMAILSLGAAAAIVVGTLTKTSQETWITASFLSLPFMLFITWDFFSVARKLASYGGAMSFLSVAIFVPLILIFLIIVWEWTRGRD
jgi:spore maturation protein SpmB